MSCGAGSTLLFKLAIAAVFLRPWINGASTSDHQELRPLNEAELSKLLSDLLLLYPSASECPAPRVPVPKHRCRAKPCARDDDCRRHSHRCCFNGCLFTCVPRLPPAAVIDWAKEPQPAGNTSKSNKDAKEVTTEKAVENHTRRPVCSLAPAHAPAAPLQCPEGMVCITRDVGDPLKGIPSLGECIVDPRHALGTTLSSGETGHAALEESIASETVFLPGGCILTKEQYKSIEEFKQKPYITGCTCKQGSVECKISPVKPFDRRRPKKR
ncbi:uncharacterized protein LOC8042420 [Ixodes scapularis]|nr:uncharacterized protein LOC8042420 [Ixodes scapularis]